MTRLVSKSGFAKEVGVSPARVSQWIGEGKITADALEGEGRSAKIKADLAKDLIYGRRDVGQSLANGKDTNLTQEMKPGSGVGPPRATPVQQKMPLTGNANTIKPASESGPSLDLKEKDADLIQRLKRLKLEREEEDALEQRRVTRGQYILTEDANAEMGRIMTQVMRSFEGGLKQFAADLSSDFEISSRDVQHTLMRSFRAVRENIYKRLEQDSELQPELEDPVDLVESDHGNIPGQPTPPVGEGSGKSGETTSTGGLC
ncbi:hypothetical protein [Pseudovibrio sp. Tun.PSC04-5.I4]|uniref:hypothetical protein n=1 Tax=Pseudovibrio sp. Tun.PSC04-5.I4 TaxID=1798213 RepID=UPI0008887E57|nr:hypothetical protein [Pseudovibrio sp. Tun.PSC04-5.I4]SDQ99504.1 hypothetical protein SAMN04515695_2225 [Pseudovibrio sp. Tun.PSC04-5.I4]